MKGSKIRYEIIYKSTVRDMRKFYTKDFNDSTSYIVNKRKHPRKFYLECLDNYNQLKLQGLSNMLNIESETLTFELGSIIYPKEMFSSY